jgi:predicted GNAT family acetyltransferase
MDWVVEEDIAAYGKRVLPWLQQDPVLNTVPSTVLVTRMDDTIATPDPWLAWLADDVGEVAGVALRTPPRGLLVTVLPPEAIEPLVAVAPTGLPVVSGRADVAEAVAAAYATRAGGRSAVDKSLRLYRLAEPAAHDPVRGRLRAAEPADVDLCARWYTDFSAEAELPVSPELRADAERVVARRRLFLWEDGGRPVTMVGHSPTVAGVTRIGPVWTPPEHRRRGYATAATAQVAGVLRASGEVVLYADTANPTSTGIYLRIGFRPVADWTDWRLEY